MAFADELSDEEGNLRPEVAQALRRPVPGGPATPPFRVEDFVGVATHLADGFVRAVDDWRNFRRQWNEQERRQRERRAVAAREERDRLIRKLRYVTGVFAILVIGVLLGRWGWEPKARTTPVEDISASQSPPTPQSFRASVPPRADWRPVPPTEATAPPIRRTKASVPSRAPAPRMRPRKAITPRPASPSPASESTALPMRVETSPTASRTMQPHTTERTENASQRLESESIGESRIGRYTLRQILGPTGADRPVRVSRPRYYSVSPLPPLYQRVQVIPPSYPYPYGIPPIAVDPRCQCGGFVQPMPWYGR